MKTKIEEFTNYSVIHLNGQFVGGEETDALFDQVRNVLESSHKNLILDFSNVTYFSSIVIGMLIKANRDFLEENGNIIICNINATLKEIFRITKVSTIMLVKDTMEEALASFDI